MPSTRDLRRRIKSVKNTSQITKAMQMVAATKMRKAQAKALGARPYNLTLSHVLSMLTKKFVLALEDDHVLTNPLLKANQSSKAGILLFSTDKGLCGALNTNLFRFIQGFDFSQNKEVVFYSVGKKGREYLVRTQKNLEADFLNHEAVNLLEVMKIRKYLVQSFLDNEVGKVYLLYPDFVSTLKQEPKLIQILPISYESIQEFLASQNIILADKDGLGEFIFEPDIDEVLDFALTHYLEVKIYQAFLEEKASEHSARMIAMQNATDNAQDLVLDLTLTYNQVRQNAITTELLEIVSAQAALE